MKLKIDESFLLDLREYDQYYRTISTELAKRFKKDVSTGLKTIENVREFQIRYEDVHCYPLEIFPFMIHYTIESDYILILALIHTAKNPDQHWIKRT